jgi:RarD protein
MKKENTSKVLMALSMFIFGTLAPFVRNIGIGSSELALYRAIMAAVMVGGFLLFARQKIAISGIKRELLLLLVSGAAMGINWIFLFEAYKYTTVSVATLSYYFAPVIVMVICPLLFKEKLTLKQIICFVMSTVGLVLITGTAGGGSEDRLGILFGLLAAIFYATVMLLNKFIKGVEGIHRTFIQFLAAMIVLLPYVMLTDGFTLGNLDGRGWGLLLVVGLVHTGLAYCMYFSAIKELAGHKVAMLSYIDPLIAVMVSVVFLNEKMTLPQIVGGILILGFTLICELPPLKKKEVCGD